MKVLIVEDQASKASDLEKFISGLLSCEIRLATSFIQARDYMCSEQFDWIILDITIPFDGARDVTKESDIEPLGGRLLLREALARGWDVQIVIVTQYPMFDTGGERVTFDGLKVESEKWFHKNYRGIVFYKRGLNSWREELADILTK